MNEFYQNLNRQLKALTEDCSIITSNLANSAALLYEELESINWAGFYLVREERLLLGPFCGRPACLEIPFGKGVCGTAAKERQILLVPDVHAFPGHIACDSRSRSEIVLPLIRDGQLLGVLDIDSPVENRFSETDREGLSNFAEIVSGLPGWENYRIQ